MVSRGKQQERAAQGRHSRKQVKLYVEGGEKGPLAAELRKEFAKLLAKMFPQKQPSVVASFGRNSAFRAFKSKIGRHGDDITHILLVDAEELPTAKLKWDHVGKRMGDNWTTPEGATESHLFFMTVTMEAWIVADVEAVKRYFGNGFKPEQLPGHDTLEAVSKADLENALVAATKTSKSKGTYEKGRDSFKLVGSLDPQVILRRCPQHFKPFWEELSRLGMR